MDMNKMDQTWVPSMPPLLSPNLKVFGLAKKTLGTVPLPEKFFKTICEKTGKLMKGKLRGRGFTQKF